MSFVNRINMLNAILLSSGTVGDVAGGVVAPEGVAEGVTMEAAPGCVTPEGATEKGRERFPYLESCGGVFRGTPDANGVVHFDISLLPPLAPWPHSKDENGADIPLPWNGHNRSKYLALTADCFDSEAAYYYYRMYEAHGKALTAYQDFVDARDGKAKDDIKKAKSQQKLLSDLEALRGELGNVPGLEDVLAAIRARNAGAVATTPVA